MAQTLIRRAASLVVALAATAACGIGIVYGTYAAADTDPFGYVSQADLIARGSLSMPNALAREMPWPYAEDSFAPPGYGTRADHTIVPTYPPGLPLVMAGFQRVGGRAAVFYVVPMLGALAVLMTGRLGFQLGGPLTAAISAVLLASSPIFLRQVVQPVSDVAATAWWVTALSLALGSGGLAKAVGAGLAASLAILTRPNLAPLAAVPAAYLLWPAVRGWTLRRGELWRPVLFAGAVVPGCLGVALFNTALYGGPLSSGYGDLGKLYAWSNLQPNLERYPLWLVQSHSPLVVLALVAPWLTRRALARGPTPLELEADRVWLLVVWIGFVGLSYLFYVPWNEWVYLRFLLPAIPACIVLAVSVVVMLPLHRLRGAMGAVSGTVAIVGWVSWQAYQAAGLGVFTLREIERRYVDLGQYIERALPRQSVFITGEHSGSIRYYSDRLTIRFDVLRPGWLDEAVRVLASRGYRTYFVLEVAEEARFREKFGPQSSLGRLDWPPSVQRSEPVQVKIYDPADRPRFMAGEPVTTGDTRPERTPQVTTRERF